MKLNLMFSFAILSATVTFGQSVMVGPEPGVPPRLLPSDAAILESPDPRRDLPCSVKAIHPELGFDLAFHSGYELGVSLRELAGNGNKLTAIFRVTPTINNGTPTYFVQNWAVPPIGERASGTVQLRGGFVLGEGRYDVEWLMRDRDERFCTARWPITVDPGRKDRVELRLPQGAVEAEAANPFANEEPAKVEGRHGLRVVVLLHMAPRTPGAAQMQPAETTAPLAIVRSIAREPRIGAYSVVAFNLEQSKVLYRQDESPRIDFLSLGDANRQLRLGTVAAQKLIEKDNRAEFLISLVLEEIRIHKPDAVIVVGTKTRDDTFTLSPFSTELRMPDCPVYYLNYDEHPIANPWRDLIGSAVKLWKGVEYGISKPRDISIVWTEVMAQLSTRKPGTRITSRAGLIGDPAPQ